MKGFLRARPAWSQFIILICVALVSLFVIGLIGGFIVSAVSGISMLEMGDVSKYDFSKPGTIMAIRGMQIVQFISLFIIPVFLCARFFSMDSKKYLGLKKPSHAGYLVLGIIIMLVAIPVANLLGELNSNVQLPSGIEQWMKEKEEESAIVIKELLANQTITDLFLNIICIAGLAAVGEELLFRGMVQRLLIKMFKSPIAGIIVTAILFSAMHMQFYGFLPRFLLGVLLGGIYWYSGSLWTAILAHFVYDAFLVVLAYFQPGMMNEETVRSSNIALMAAISFGIVVFILIWMKRKSVTTYDKVYADDKGKNHPFDFEQDVP